MFGLQRSVLSHQEQKLNIGLDQFDCSLHCHCLLRKLPRFSTHLEAKKIYQATVVVGAKKGKEKKVFGTKLPLTAPENKLHFLSKRQEISEIIANVTWQCSFLPNCQSRYDRPCRAKPPSRKSLPKRRKPVAKQNDGDAATRDVDAVDRTSSASGEAKVHSKDIQGLKYFEMLLPLLERLHSQQCEREKAGNRGLLFDKCCTLDLLYMFNPTVASLRAIAQASELEKVQEKLGCRKTSFGSLSEASRLFDSEPLKEVIREFGEQASPIRKDTKLSQINHTITLVDGSTVSALPSIMQASLLKQTEGSGLVQWRLHTHFEVDRYVPTRIDVTPNGGGEYSCIKNSFCVSNRLMQSRPKQVNRWQFGQVGCDVNSDFIES